MVYPMNSVLLFPDANENEKLERVGGAAAWYWACGLMFCRRREQRRREKGEAIDFIPEASSLTLFADTKAKAHVAKLIEVKLWHVVEGGYQVNDYEKLYRDLALSLGAPAGPADIQPEPAEHQPAGDEPPQPTASQLGGMARSLTSRTPAGTFQPTPAGSQPAASQLVLVSPTPPSDPEDPQKLGSERDLEKDPPENKGSGAGARAARKRATPLPVEFGLTAEHIAFGAGKDWPEWWMRNRCEQFCDLAAAKGWTYKDWKLALYTFLRNEITYGRGPAAMARFNAGSGTQNGPGFRPRGPVQNNHGQTGFEAVTGTK
jgi:hypothetical protein